ncbi:hypothetical protein CBS101457_006541 [Exobasidium rhododendri]|nr:hypothetical protein CBS101457_006541 [Exobasidium rhododendri]
MVGRHSHPPTSNVSSIQGNAPARRRSRGEEDRDGGGRGSKKNEEGSDVDELGDSDSERAEQDVTAKTRAPAGRGHSRGRTRGSTAGARSVSNRQAADKKGNGVRSSRTSPASSSSVSSPPSHTAMTVPQQANTTSRGHAFDSTPAQQSNSNPANAEAPSYEGNKEHPQPSQQAFNKVTSSGGPPHYYQPSGSVANGAGVERRGSKSSPSPRSSPLKKNDNAPTLSFRSDSGHKSITAAAAATTPLVSATPLSKQDDLTLQEVDRFLDLIEKHNLHTSNEDDMARSVTELYQEWLEWCAKRNVQSTKSKQALVAEFVRIHQGNYGTTRQKRAMEIVQGNAGGSSVLDGDGDSIQKSMEREEEAKKNPRSLATLSHSKSTPSIRPAPRYKEEEQEGTQSIQQQQGRTAVPKRSTIRTDAGSQFIHIPSPSMAPRALTPGPAGSLSKSYKMNHQGISPNDLDALHRQIRDEVWRDASTMITQLIHEQMNDLLIEKNVTEVQGQQITVLRGRVEQLEIHSDNLAQWIQHLNRVQDDFASSLRTSAPSTNALHASHPPPSTREEVIIEESIGTYGGGGGQQQKQQLQQHQQYPTIGHPMREGRGIGEPRLMPSNRDRTYATQYDIGPNSAQSSPKRVYAVRRSPSPVIIHHQSSNSSASSARRPAPIVTHPPPPLNPPPHSSRQYNPPPPSSPRNYRDHTREPRDNHYNTPSIHHGHRVVPSEQYERPYYTYPPDDGKPPPLPTSPRQAKRARNGY